MGECFRNRSMEAFGVFIILKFVSLETRNMRRSRECLVGWKHWKMVIGYACVLALITERGLPFPAAKRLALCGGEEACPLPRCRGLPLV